jgi:hypothetical protein
VFWGSYTSAIDSIIQPPKRLFRLPNDLVNVFFVRYVQSVHGNTDFFGAGGCVAELGGFFETGCVDV